MSRNGDHSMSDTPNEQPSVAELMKSHDALQAQGIVLETAHALCGISKALETAQESLEAHRQYLVALQSDVARTRDQMHEAVKELLSLVESPPAAPTTLTALLN